MAFCKIQCNNLIVLLARRSGNSVLNCSVIMFLQLLSMGKFNFLKYKSITGGITFVKCRSTAVHFQCQWLMGFYITLCAVHTTQGQGIIVFYRTDPHSLSLSRSWSRVVCKSHYTTFLLPPDPHINSFRLIPIKNKLTLLQLKFISAHFSLQSIGHSFTGELLWVYHDSLNTVKFILGKLYSFGPNIVPDPRLRLPWSHLLL